MKKIFKVIITTGVILSFSSSIESKAQVFGEGYKFISIGYGFPNVSSSIFNLYESRSNYTVKGLGPMHGKFEYGITEKIGIGISLNYVSTEVRWDDGTYREGFDYSALAANVRINFHFLDHEKVDFYYGLGMGYNHVSTSYFYTGNNTQEENFPINLLPVGIETTIGLRYMFSPSVGAYLEMGWAKSLMQAGIVSKF